MKNNNLFASVALFSELYNSESYKSIPDILAEFIKGAIVYENKFSLNSTELKDLMIKVYGFNIPESVLRTILHSKFKKFVKFENKIFHFEQEIKDGLENINNSIESINKQHLTILEELFKYIEVKTNKELSNNEKEHVFRTFSQILMDNGYSDKYSDLISAFIISNEKNNFFKDNLNSIKEGLILYQGINFTADLNELGSWKNELTIFLSTEHLFNCLNYNGELFKEIFDDFYKLILEINNSAKNKSKGKKIIELKYFEETKNEVDYFFISAESIFKGYKKLDPTKEAMKNILNNCESISDIKAKQVKFYSDLKHLGIEYQSVHFDIQNSEFNVVDQSLIEELNQKSQEKGKQFDEEYCLNVLRIFTKVNTFRRGNNKLPFENVKYIYITENGFAKYLAHEDKVKFENYDIPFAKDIDFITSKFWFKLKKGFNNKNELPKSFDVITKAKIIISSHLNSSLSKNYDKLHEEFKQGKLSEELAVELSLALKEKSELTDNINANNIEISIDFLNDDEVLENYLREKTRKESLHEKTKEEKKILEIELQVYKQKELEIEEKKIKEKQENELKIFLDKKWATHKKEITDNVKYYIYVTILTFLPITIGFLLKTIPVFNDFIISIGNKQYIIWFILSAIFVVELQGRSYIFDKVKIKNGFDIIKIWITSKFKIYKIEKIKEFKNEFTR